MSINDIFVGQQVCKQTHTHAKLYRTHTVLITFIQTDYFCALYSSDQTSYRL